MAKRVNKHKPASVRAAPTRAEVMRLRAEGATYREIAAELGISLGYAHKIVMREMGELTSETKALATEYRSKQLDELEEIARVWLPRVKSSGASPQDLTAYLKLLVHEAELTGAKAPARTEVTGAEGGALKTETATTVDVSVLTNEQLKALAALHGAIK